jgi:amino acid transporter
MSNNICCVGDSFMQEEGGTYYLISRALGPRIGGAVGCMYYLGVALLAVLETLGAVEMLLFTFTGIQIPAATRILSIIILVTLGVLVRVLIPDSALSAHPCSYFTQKTPC